MATIDKNRVKFYLGGYVLDAANPLIPGRPHDRLVDILADEQTGRVLELCTGTGYVARRLAAVRPGQDVHGIDISPEMLAIGRRHARRDALDARGIVGDGLVSMLIEGGLTVEHAEPATTWTPTQLVVATKPS